jgi:hypothetical protein
MTSAAHLPGVHFGHKDVQVTAVGTGAVLLLLGILGFIPGVTTSYANLAFLGPDSHAMLLGIFQVSMLLNIVTLVVGAVGLLLSRSGMSARTFLMGAGALYVVLGIFGMIVGADSAANFLALNVLDMWTQLVLGLAMVAFGWLLSRHLADAE